MEDDNIDYDAIEQDLRNQVYGLDATSQEATTAIENLQKINQMNKKPERLLNRLVPSGDSVLGALASILGILAVLNYERLHPLASKAVGFISKIRL